MRIINNKSVCIIATVMGVSLIPACMSHKAVHPEHEKQWLAGDHHVHSRYSVGYDWENPADFIVGNDGVYPIPMNALMARHFGLDWMVATDHGGPNHSKINFELAYPELQLSRNAEPDVVQFYGMEFNTPAADHSSVIIPHTHDESRVLRDLESRFDAQEVWTVEERQRRNREGRMLEALRAMDQLGSKPLVFANHPARSAPALGEYGETAPHEMRAWNDTAPEVAVGMEGAPGHQAGPLSSNPAPRGWYFDYPTMGGFDQMTARLGGFWDSMIGEGRRWWITANSDSHRNYVEGGVAFWPGQYAKTYVYATKDYDAILSAIRGGEVFVTTGDLISELYVDVFDVEGEATPASVGGTVTLSTPGSVEVRVRARDPDGQNHNGDNPVVARIDLIAGNVTGPADEPSLDTNPSTRVVKRFAPGDWRKQGEYLEMSHRLIVDGPVYVRVRGTNTEELEPDTDPPDEDPWPDLWFYSNPVFIEIR